MLRPVRTVLATTKEEVDAALATADQITVEGGDELLSYAVDKAAEDPENRITFKAFTGDEDEKRRAALTLLRAEEKPRAGANWSPRFVVVSAVIALLLIVIIFNLVIWQGAPIRPTPLPGPPEPPPAPVHTTTDFWAILPSLLWPLVAIAAILALFLIARQAISSGSNVTTVWKVTEKVSGRVVITKVRERAPRKRVAA